MFDGVYKVIATGLVKVGMIPNLLLNHSVYFYGKLFTFNNKLYATSGTDIFKYEDNHFVYQKTMPYGLVF